MRFPPRLGHLATRAVVVARLAPSYADVHGVSDDEARGHLERALATALYEELLASTWNALRAKHKRLDEAAILEEVAESLGERPLRPGRKMPQTPDTAAFWLLLDVQAGTASESARRVLESDRGRAAAQAGMAEAGAFLARELVR